MIVTYRTEGTNSPYTDARPSYYSTTTCLSEANQKLERLFDDTDFVFLLMDSRESMVAYSLRGCNGEG